MPTDDVSVVDALSATRVMRAIDIGSKLHQAVVQVVVDHPTAPTSIAFFQHKASRQDTYTGTGTGTAVDVSAQTMSHFAIQVAGTGAVPTSFTVVLEVSLDGTNYSTLLTHTNLSPGNLAVLHSGAAVLPVLYFRSKCTAVALGSATNIVVTIVGVSR